MATSMSLSWSPNPAKWHDKDLTLETGAPTAAGDPMGYVFADTQHVVFRASDGHIHELWWKPNPATWYDKDLTKESIAPIAAGDPMGYVFADTQHVVFRATDSHIHELWWKPNPATWYDKDLTNEAKSNGSLAIRWATFSPTSSMLCSELPTVVSMSCGGNRTPQPGTTKT